MNVKPTPSPTPSPTFDFEEHKKELTCPHQSRWHYIYEVEDDPNKVDLPTNDFVIGNGFANSNAHYVGNDVRDLQCVNVNDQRALIAFRRYLMTWAPSRRPRSAGARRAAAASPAKNLTKGMSAVLSRLMPGNPLSTSTPASRR
jgi:hypothetical protein